MTPAAAALASALRTFVDEQMIRVRAAFDAAEGGDDVTAGAWYAWAEREVNAVLNAVSTAVRDSAWHKAAWRTLHDVTPGMDELSLYVDRDSVDEPYEPADLIDAGRLALEVGH